MGPGPRRGHTAARAFQIGPVQLATHAIICFRGSEATVDQLTRPIALPVIRQVSAAAITIGTTLDSMRVIQYAPSLARTALSVLPISRRSLAIDQLST